jgi:excisionase family DNA binding protein
MSDELRERIKELLLEKEHWQAQANKLARSVTRAVQDLTEELREHHARVEALCQRVEAAEANAKEREEKTYLTADEAAAYMRICKQTLAKLRHERRSPPYRKVGGRVLYQRAELERWMNMSSRGNYP